MTGHRVPEAGDRGRWRLAGVPCRLLVLGLVCAVMSGCLAKRSSYDVPAIPVATQFKNPPPAAKPEAEPAGSGGKDVRPLPSSGDAAGFEDWWRSFGNQELNGLVNRGLANNPDVRIATIRLAQAKVRADQARAGLFPSVSMPTLAARQAPGGTVGSVPVGSASRAPQNAFQGSLRGDLRVDIWGEQSSLVESANLQLWRAAYERDNTQRNVAASIVSSYVEYASLNDRLRIARETERVLSDTLQTMQRRLDLGDATLGDFEQQKALVFGLRGAIPTIEQQREDALNSLAFLVGSVPGAITLSEQGLDTLSVPAVVPGLPSSLLLRRPDVRMAEARLLSADADIDVARARILPPLDLSAQSGYSSNMLSQFFLPKFFFWSTVASLTASIFDAGKREGEKKFNESLYEEMVENYARTIYQAMREVEGALATIRLAGKRLDAQREAADAARRAWEINTRVYAMGGADHLTLLESERTYHRYLDEFQRSQMEHYRGYTSLFLALGGGVRVAAPTPGEGKRPGGGLSGRIEASSAAVNASDKAFSVDGLDLDSGGINPWSSGNAQAFWQVELPGLYHRNTVGAAWRDLRGRYPQDMEGRMVRPRLNGRIDDSIEGQEAWYRLYVASFATLREAHVFCQKMQASQERCRVVNAKGEEVPLAELPKDAASRLPLSARDAAVAPDRAPGSSPAILPVPTEVAVPSEAVRGAGDGRVAHTIQLGAFSNLENAAISSAVWQFRGYEVYVAETRGGDGRVWYAVRTGIYPERRDAANAAQQIRRKDEAPAVLVPTILGPDGQPEQVDISDVLTPKAGNDTQVLPEPPEIPAVATERVQTEKNIIKPVAAAAVRPASKAKLRYAVQLGAFSSQENAEVSRKYWQGRGLDVHISTLKGAEGRLWYGVRTGAFTQRREASALALQLGRKETASAIVVAAAVDVLDEAENLPAPATANPSPAPIAGEIAAASTESASLPAAPSVQLPRFSIQLGVFSSIENAAKAFAEWQLLGYEPYVCDTGEVSGKPRFAVRTGEFRNKREAQSMVRIIERQESRRGLVVPAVLDAKGALSRIDVTPLLENATAPQSANLTSNDAQ